MSKRVAATSKKSLATSRSSASMRHGLGQVLLGHLANGDGADIYFLAGYQLQEEVERSCC